MKTPATMRYRRYFILSIFLYIYDSHNPFGFLFFFRTYTNLLSVCRLFTIFLMHMENWGRNHCRQIQLPLHLCVSFNPIRARVRCTVTILFLTTCTCVKTVLGRTLSMLKSAPYSFAATFYSFTLADARGRNACASQVRLRRDYPVAVADGRTWMH